MVQVHLLIVLTLSISWSQIPEADSNKGGSSSVRLSGFSFIMSDMVSCEWRKFSPSSILQITISALPCFKLKFYDFLTGSEGLLILLLLLFLFPHDRL